MNQPLLYEHPLSSYAQKVEIVLRETAFARASPRGEVPALVDGDLAIFDSTVFCEYCEDRWPSPALLPGDAAG